MAESSAAETGQPTAPAAKPRRSRRRLAAKFAFSLVVALIALKIGDVLLGRFANTSQRHWLRLTPNAAARHVSTEFDYVYHTNALGLRGRDIPFEKPAGTRRIVLVGDSFVAGQGVRDEAVFSVRLESRLREAGRQVEVVNVGSPGSSTIREREFYQQLGRRFEPDEVILVCFLGNDLPEVTEERTPDERASWRPAGFVRSWAYALFPNTYLELAIAKRAVASRDESRPKSSDEIAERIAGLAQARGVDPETARRRYRRIPQNVQREVERGRYPFRRVLYACLEPDRFVRAIDPGDEFFQHAWPRMRAQLDLLKRDVERDGARFRLCIIPDVVQVDPDGLAFQRSLGMQVDDRWLKETTRTQQALADWAHGNGVPCLDLTPACRSAGERLYHIWDGHLNETGHALTARLIAESLLKAD